MTIPSLVMRPDHRNHVTRKIHVGEHLDTRQGVTLDQIPLVRSELTWLVQHLRWNNQLAHVMHDGADTEPEHLARLETGTHGESARQIGDTLTMALGIAILRFNGCAPVPDRFEKMPLETRVATINVSEIAFGAQLRKDPMPPIQVHQCVAMTTLLAAQLRMLACRFSGQQEVATVHGDLLGALQMFFGRGQLAHFAGDGAEMFFDLAERQPVPRLRRQRHG